MLYNIIIAPIETVVDWVFIFITTKFSDYGIIGAVCGVSLIINFLALPLYNIADSLQEKERKAYKALEPRIKRIKKAFKGNEQFMMLSTYYRQNDYHPLYVLRSSLSILIEIPFFIAAYHYLSNCEALRGASFWILKDLGSPDGLLHIGNFSIHVLPILMTLINFISGAVYTKEAPFREKIQLYIVAVLFLVLLYASPSGLVIYWILNNLFSLVKNIVMKMKDPRKILHAVISSLLLLVSVYFITKDGAFWKKVFVFLFSLGVTVFPYIKNKFLLKNKVVPGSNTKTAFILLSVSGIGLAILVGLLLPSNIIATSPIEFSFLGNTDSPLAYIRSNLFISIGFFIFWPLCIFKMFGSKVKKIEALTFAVLFFCAFANAFIFKFDYGVIDTTLSLEKSSVLRNISIVNLTVPLLIIPLIVSMCFILLKFNKAHYISLFIIAVGLAGLGISITKILHIKSVYNKYAKNYEKSHTATEEIKPVYHLSKEGKNVVVLFLDRAINSFLPYALKELPELAEQLKGFVYYPNTLSFSSYTDIGSPAMMAGYEYTPEKLNARSSELLQKKHNEASLVLPTLFANAGYEVTITDPPCPNYSWKGDLSNFESKKNIHAYELFGKYSSMLKKELKLDMDSEYQQDLTAHREMLNFTILEILPPILRNTFYGDFRRPYWRRESFLNTFSCLYYLPKLTDFSASENQYIFIDNETPHEPRYLSADFITVCNKDEAPKCVYQTDDDLVFVHYQTFVAALKQVGKWFDFLRENNVYDNTRIIIVADHGRHIPLSDFSDFSDPTIPSSYDALLLVKDFNGSAPLSIDNDFMTNADTLFFAKKGLPVSNINPFTNKSFEVQKENGINVYPCEGTEWNPEQMVDKTQFTLDKTKAFHVSNDIFQEKNWIPLLQWEAQQNVAGGKR